jgi:hypothetical protein
MIGVLGFDSRRGLEIFLFITASRIASYLMGTSGFFPGVKGPGREANSSPPSSVEVNECMELYLHSPIRLHGVVLSLKYKHRDNFTFTLPLSHLISEQLKPLSIPLQK